MNRKQLLIGAGLALVAVRVFFYFYSNWGLITIHATKEPLSKIVSQIQRQGHVTLMTNLDPATPVTMHVTKVPLSQALEALSVVTDSRWRLNYFLAPDKTTLSAGINAIAAGNKPDDWKIIYYRVPMMFLPESGIVPDPRTDLWPSKAPADNTLQANLDGAAKMANVAFALPENWNPPISSPPGSGDIARVVPKLARAARGKTEQIFLLTKFNRGQGQGGDRQAQQDGPPPDDGQPRNYDWMADRAQAQINRLPADQRTSAQSLLDRMRAFWKQLSDLPPDQRRAKWQEMMNDPQLQNQMQQMQNLRDALSTPDQKIKRAQNYVDNKQALLHP